MTSQKQEEKSATREGGEDAEEVAAPSKMKLVAHYAMLGFPPLLAIVALVVAVVAVSGSRSSQEQLDKITSDMNGVSASLSSTRSELEKLRFALSRDNATHDEERKKQDELLAKVIQNINQVQVKAKISPTLGDQLAQAASAPVAAPAAAGAAPAPAPGAGAKGPEKKLGAQMNAMKEAIEQFNKQ